MINKILIKASPALEVLAVLSEKSASAWMASPWLCIESALLRLFTEEQPMKNNDKTKRIQRLWWALVSELILILPGSWISS